MFVIQIIIAINHHLHTAPPCLGQGGFDLLERFTDSALNRSELANLGKITRFPKLDVRFKRCLRKSSKTIVSQMVVVSVKNGDESHGIPIRKKKTTKHIPS